MPYWSHMMRDKYYWPGMFKDIRQHVLGCSCALHKPVTRDLRSVMVPIVASRPLRAGGLGLGRPTHLADRGIAFQAAAPHHQQANGMVEAMIKNGRKPCVGWPAS